MTKIYISMIIIKHLQTNKILALNNPLGIDMLLSQPTWTPATNSGVVEFFLLCKKKKKKKKKKETIPLGFLSCQDSFLGGSTM